MNSPLRKTNSKQTFNWNRALVTITCLSILAAFFWGVLRESENVYPHLKLAFPVADQFTKHSADTFLALKNDIQIGYVTISEGHGYGGPLKTATAIDEAGLIVGVSIVRQRETPSWFQKILDSEFTKSFVGKKVTDLFQIGNDVDAVSGATYTSRAIIKATQTASWNIARNELNLPLPIQQTPDLQINLPEIVLVFLIMLWLVAKYKFSNYKKQIRWFSLLVSLVVLGFIYDNPLTLAFINKMLMGYWPDWRNHLYWYILISFAIITFVWSSKNIYCHWICPFGAAQECINVLGGAKSRNPHRFQVAFIWIQRSLAWVAIMAALIFRNPGISSYEIFGNLFELRGSGYQFILLGIVMIGSVFIKRPWCRYLCPIAPIYDFFKYSRNKIKGKWKQLKPT
jgi:NosR/NirI family transcriptional regulator, nitrous oxide reductase regulator